MWHQCMIWFLFACTSPAVHIQHPSSSIILVTSVAVCLYELYFYYFTPLSTFAATSTGTLQWTLTQKFYFQGFSRASSTRGQSISAKCNKDTFFVRVPYYFFSFNFDTTHPSSPLHHRYWPPVISGPGGLIYGGTPDHPSEHHNTQANIYGAAELRRVWHPFGTASRADSPLAYRLLLFSHKPRTIDGGLGRRDERKLGRVRLGSCA
jgi:hypothetical protein